MTQVSKAVLLGNGPNIPKRAIITLLVIITMVFICMTEPVSAKTPDNDWITGAVNVERRPDLSTNPDTYGMYGSCENATVQLPNFWGDYQDTVACVFQAKSFQYTITPEGVLYIGGRGGSTMYPLRNVGFYSLHHVIPSPSTDNIVFADKVFKDLPSNITLHTDDSKPYYEANGELTVDLSVDSEGTTHQIHSAGSAVSRNGKWVIANFRDVGFVRFNLVDMSAKWIAPNRNIAEFMAISNDGKHVAVASFSSMAPPAIFGVEDCGRDSDRFESGWTAIDISKACTPRDLSNEINEALSSSWFTSNARPDFSEDGLSLTLFVRPNNVGGEGIILRLQAEAGFLLDYLALGDSYSSGEGDTGKLANGQSFYLPPTDSIGGCHLSARSYPFLLAQSSGLQDERMQSVACSGAQITKDYHGTSDTYLGQGNRLKGKTDVQLATDRTSALTDFTPGVLKQLDFVKATQPKVVTLTGGGNDVGFGPILSYCAHIVHNDRPTGTCDYAKKGTKLHGSLASAIKTQYKNMNKLIAEIKIASPKTTIYVVGYPSFVVSKFGCVNDASLNPSEADMINTSVTYMNNVLKQAAKSAGAHFVNVENSLLGGRICEGGSYMTAPTALIGGAGIQELFHPNAAGNEKLAQTIAASGFTVAANSNPQADTSALEPAVPSYFSSATIKRTEQQTMSSSGTVKQGQKVQLSIPKALLKSATTVALTLFSDTTKLGTYKTLSDGSFNQAITIPTNVKPGYHVLYVEATAEDGQPITLYQFIEVTSAQTNDTDGDGIKNDKDNCQYITQWYDEATNKDICKTKSNTQPGSGHGGNNNGGTGHHSGPSHRWNIPKLFAHHWRFAPQLHAWFGIVLCVGIIGFRFR